MRLTILFLNCSSEESGRHSGFPRRSTWHSHHPISLWDQRCFSAVTSTSRWSLCTRWRRTHIGSLQPRRARSRAALRSRPCRRSLPARGHGGVCASARESDQRKPWSGIELELRLAPLSPGGSSQQIRCSLLACVASLLAPPYSKAAWGHDPAMWSFKWFDTVKCSLEVACMSISWFGYLGIW
jgi:hypothetical protein